ncbi:MAG UNVERIFIED_CONTAM: hypothetical protein LVQ98_03525 [Rickettsiaceae bacterium]|jgi:hypothetical protein
MELLDLANALSTIDKYIYWEIKEDDFITEDIRISTTNLWQKSKWYALLIL